jgi:hypothetical protein
MRDIAEGRGRIAEEHHAGTADHLVEQGQCKRVDLDVYLEKLGIAESCCGRAIASALDHA